MLVRNGRSIFQNPGSFAGVVKNQDGNVVKGGFRNRFVGGLSAVFGGYANGHLAPASFVLPTQAGSMSSYTESSEQLSADVIVLIPGLPMNGSSTITITAAPFTIDKIVALIASGSLVLTVDAAQLSAAVDAIVNGSATLSTSAELGGIFSVLASANMVLVPSGTLTAQAFMEAAAGGPTPLSPEGLANAVWERAVDAGYSAEEILRVLAAVAAGKTDITGSTVTFRDLGDTKDRIVASMTGSERTTITIDES
jgi:hypothetical protein